MKAEALTPRDLFDGNVHFEIPAFQRPYVWTEEDQWQPLWDDILRVVEMQMAAGADRTALDAVPGHFLGAVVVKQLDTAAGGPSRSSVIDGQQRLTTLQLLLDAAQLVTEEAGCSEAAESLQELVLNGAARFRGVSSRFKLWPSRIDRAPYEHVMDNERVVPADLAETQIVRAHAFFRSTITSWISASGSEEIKFSQLTCLADVLQGRLQIVAINLAGDDDDQLIFETLNDRGTALLAADLIKNFIFQECERIGADVDAWSETYWQDFDADWWRGEVSQGRLFRSRIDLFLQYWLTMRLKDEIPSDAVFSVFRDYAAKHLEDVATAERFLVGLRRDADTFRDFAELDQQQPLGRFYSRVIEALELGAFIPLFLWLISETHRSAPTQADKALEAIESWVVRRTLLRRTMKDVNHLVVALLKELDRHPAEAVGDATVRFLLDQTADARQWPSDGELESELPGLKLYGNIKGQRLRAVLSAVELQLRSGRHEDVTLPPRLDIEHIMPQGWRSFWGASIANDLESQVRRDRIVNTIGNLTLVTAALNAALSNRPWTDEEALEVAPTGKDAGLGKKSLLSRYSVLVLNKDVVDENPTEWTEADIAGRSIALTKLIAKSWPIPQSD